MRIDANRHGPALRNAVDDSAASQADTRSIIAGGYTNPPLHDAVDDSDAAYGSADSGAGDDDRAWPSIGHRDSNDVHDACTAVGADWHIRPRRRPNDRNGNDANSASAVITCDGPRRAASIGVV
jgi:hypothetical protein